MSRGLLVALASLLPTAGDLVLVDVSGRSGVDFRFQDGSRGKHDLVEIMGGGLALIDADGDGLLDLYLCQGGPIVPNQGKNGDDPPCRLYRNLGGFRFRDITDRTNAPGPSYAMGAAVGDIDGDGRDDLLVTGWRNQRLYRNLGQGRFEDITARAGLASDLWGTSAAFADLDGDGDLDLYVCNYVDYDPAKAPYCAAPDGRRDYCGPEDFRPQPHRLYRNDGGRFADVSEASGIAMEDGRGLGVLIADLVGDPRPDLFVANDGTPCRLFENLGGLRFRDVAAASGVALDGRGEAIAGMGVALADLDDDGQPDLLVGNLFGRTTIGFRGLGGGQFRDDSEAFGLSAATRDVTGFGLAAVDLDGDGRPDVVQANGHVLDRERLGVPFRMPPTLLRGQGGRLARLDSPAGPMLGRGLAVGDLDGDGRPDVVVAPLDGPPRILRNASGGRWLRVDGARPGDLIRATVAGRTRELRATAGGSYLASGDRRLYLGLGDAETAERIEIRRPSGHSVVRTDASGVIRMSDD